MQAVAYELSMPLVGVDEGQLSEQQRQMIACYLPFCGEAGSDPEGNGHHLCRLTLNQLRACTAPVCFLPV